MFLSGLLVAELLAYHAAAVEAVVNFWARPPDCSEEVWAKLEDKMVQEVGDDDEFEAIQEKDDVYQDGWFDGVIAAHETM